MEKKEKATDFLYNFYIFHKSSIKFFLKYFINKFLETHI